MGIAPSPSSSRECDQQQEEQMEREARVLQGLVDYLLPQVGGHVATLDLAHGTAVSNEMVRERTVRGECVCSPCHFGS